MKLSFFDRLSGNSSMGDDFESFEDEAPMAVPTRNGGMHVRTNGGAAAVVHPADSAGSSEGQLPVDVYQTPNEIIVRAFVAGVRPDELNISISREIVEIGGSRAEREQVADNDYFTRELFWGSFSRTVLLPQEIDVESAAASAKDGLLTIILPKLDKARQTKLRVKAG